MSIITVGNQTFLSSPANNISINLTHIIKVAQADYYYYEGEEDEDIKQSAKCFAILTSDGEWNYIAMYSNEGYVERGSTHYSVYYDPKLYADIEETFF